MKKTRMKPVRKETIKETREKRGAWITAGLCAVFFAGGVMVPVLMDLHKSQDLDKVQAVYDLLKNKWYYAAQSEDISTELAEKAISGMTTLEEDPHTNYFNLEEAKAFTQSLSGSNVGIGITYYRNADDEMTVRNVYQNSTADQAGLQAGDVIVKVGTKQTAGLPDDEIVQTIRNYAGQKLPVSVRRQDQTLEMTLVPGEYDTTVITDVIDGTGIIELSSFSENSGTEFRKAAESLKEAGVQDVIIDLRGNTGGYLSAAKEIAETLLPADKVIFQEKDKDGTIKELKTENDDQVDFGRIVILQDGNSASASEVLIGALKENLDNVTTVGTTTYGKGTEQVSVPFTDGTSLKYTIAEWLTPSGQSINKTGFAPDIEQEKEEVGTVVYPGLEEGEQITEDTVNDNAAAVQVFLAYLGYPADRDDNYFDAAGAQAVRQFQADNGLEVTGVVDKTTFDKLTSLTLIRIYENEATEDAQRNRALAFLRGE